MARSDRFTIKTKQREHYSDFLINFDKSPVTGYLGKATNDEAIKQSLKNLLLTNEGDWPFESYIGSKVSAAMFELNDPRLQTEVESSVAECIRNNEPRVELLSVQLLTDENTYEAFITVTYTILNIPDETFEFSVAINRVR